MDFKEFIKSDREKHNKQKFKGTFLDYLEIVKIILMLQNFLIKGFMILLWIRALKY